LLNPDVGEFTHDVLFARPRFSLLVLGIFACAGVVLVALGVYGVLAYTVSQQTREIAIRLALGGDRGHIVRRVLSWVCRWWRWAWSSASPYEREGWRPQQRANAVGNVAAEVRQPHQRARLARQFL
jgi:hypothetical protein